jgi:hypothetical protein
VVISGRQNFKRWHRGVIPDAGGHLLYPDSELALSWLHKDASFLKTTPTSSAVHLCATSGLSSPDEHTNCRSLIGPLHLISSFKYPDKCPSNPCLDLNHSMPIRIMSNDQRLK